MILEMMTMIMMVIETALAKMMMTMHDDYDSDDSIYFKGTATVSWSAP